MDALDHLVAVGGHQEILATHEVRIVGPEELLSLARQTRLLSLRVEPEAHLDDVVDDVVIRRGVVDVPAHTPLTGRDRNPHVLGIRLPRLAHAVAGDPDAPPVPHGEDGVPVVDDLLSVGVGRLEFGRHQPALLIDSLEGDVDGPPLVLPEGRDREGCRADHDVRRPARARSRRATRRPKGTRGAGGGRPGSPSGAPASAHCAISSISSSESEMSFLKVCPTPISLSRCQGGMCRIWVCSLIIGAQGRASW